MAIAGRSQRFDFVLSSGAVDARRPWGCLLPIENLPGAWAGDEPIIDRHAASLAGQHGGLLILDSSDEAVPCSERFWRKLRGECATAGMAINRVAMLHQIGNAADMTAQSFVGVDAGERPVVIYYHAHLRRLLAETLAAYDAPIREAHLQAISRADPDAHLRAKRFICLNNVARSHRLMTMMKLAQAGALGDSHVSYAGKASYKREALSEPILARVGREIFGAAFDALRWSIEERSPIIADLAPESTNRRRYIFSANLELHATSYLSIVTETEVSDGSIERFTEKTFKPIAGGHPFIVVGNPRTLRALRDLGFQTFGEAIDESYDEIDDPIERLKALFREFDRLFVMSRAELAALYRRALPAIVHNYRHFYERLGDLIDARWEKAVFDGLHAAWERSRHAPAGTTAGIRAAKDDLPLSCTATAKSRAPRKAGGERR